MTEQLFLEIVWCVKFVEEKEKKKTNTKTVCIFNTHMEEFFFLISFVVLNFKKKNKMCVCMNMRY